MKRSSYHRVENLTFLLITILGVLNGSVTVFYIIYLFWLQELLRTFVDLAILFRQKKTLNEKWLLIKTSFGSFFILWIYLVFIVLLFGFMLNWEKQELLRRNIEVLMFRNWYFNSNMLLFLAEYIYFRNKSDNTGLQLSLFNPRHIILHISIILGALIQLAIIPSYSVTSLWASAWVVLPFLALKILVNKTVKINSP